MSTDINAPESVTGNEALTVGEKLGSFFKELSVGIDSFNAKAFNKSIHKLDGIEIWNKLGAANNYFDVSTKHIPTPVFFNPNKVTFADFVTYVLGAVPILKLIDGQADMVYSGLKSLAATGKMPFSISQVDTSYQINEARGRFKEVMEDTRVYTRAVNEVYPNFSGAFQLMKQFNDVTDSLKSRDVELAAKRGDQVIYILKLLKPKIDQSQVILTPREVELVNSTVRNLIDNITFAGLMLSQLSELTAVLKLQVKEAQKLMP